ncbi:MAG TPA: hypothetical protein VFT59_02020 [Candidatus Saccharimonadales bacterium]|nr:hypothetical protein [Candidatus Saccharimonadales bacterium]
MELPEQSPNYVRIKGTAEVVPVVMVTAVYETLMRLMNQGILEALALGDLYLTSRDIEYRVTDHRLVEILQRVELASGVNENGQLIVPAITKQIVVAATEPEATGFRIRPFQEVIEMP